MKLVQRNENYIHIEVNFFPVLQFQTMLNQTNITDWHMHGFSDQKSPVTKFCKTISN